MKRFLLRPRLWIAVLLAFVAGVAAYFWPATPRAEMACERNCWHLAFSPDNTKLAALDRDPGLHQMAKVQTWDAVTGDLLHRIDLGFRHYPSKIVFSPDSKTVGVLDVGAVTIWDADTGKKIANHAHHTWSADPDHFRSCEILFSPNGDWLLHDAIDGRVYDVKTGEVVHDYHKRWPDRSFGVHGGCGAALVQGEVKTFNVLTGDEIATFKNAKCSAKMSAMAFTFSPDGTRGFYFNGVDQWVCYDAIAERESGLPLDGSDMILTDGILMNRGYLFVAIARQHRSVWDMLRTEMTGGTFARVFDGTTGAEVGTPFRNGHLCCFTQDGKTLAVGDRRSQIAIWDWPPPTRWPVALVVAAIAFALSLGIATWMRRRAEPRKRPVDDAVCQPAPDGARLAVN